MFGKKEMRIFLLNEGMDGWMDGWREGGRVKWGWTCKKKERKKEGKKGVYAGMELFA